MPDPIPRLPSLFRQAWCRRAGRVAVLCLALLLLVAGLLALLLLEGKPLLDPERKLSNQEVAEARKVLDLGIRSARQVGVTSTVELTAEEMDATVNYLLKQFGIGIAHFELESDGFTFVSTVQVPYLPWSAYINVAIFAKLDGGRLTLRGARLGDANLSAAAVEAGLTAAQRFSPMAKLVDVADQAVKDMEVTPYAVRLVYGWDSESLARMRGLILEITGKKRLRHYQARLADVVNRPGQGRRMALGELLQPLFVLARERSEDRDPIEENRALLMVLSSYLSGHKTASVLAAYSSVVAERRTVLLRKRLDLAKHFAISAALAASASGTFADLAGLAKEIDDSHGGSGFNFQDLAADMAGQRFGQLAVASEKSARRLQKRMSGNAEDDAIMPSVRDLPENLDARAFAERYGGVGGTAFDLIQQDIEQRLDAMALYWPHQAE